MPYANVDHPSDVHEQFLERASRIFPVEASRSWSKLERAVFNVLIGDLIFNHGYKNISDEMLIEACQQMDKIVRMKDDPPSAQCLPAHPAADRSSAGRMAL